MTVPFELVGTVEVVDLEAACALYGRDMLPYPLGRSRPVGSVWLFTREVGPIEDRLGGGDLRGVRAWVEALVREDVCVECRVRYRDEDIPDSRLHGLRSGESAFVAVQHSDSDGGDVVDIYAVAPGGLAAAVADSVGLVGAGSQARIAVGDRYAVSSGIVEEYDAFGFPIPPTGPGSRAIYRVAGDDVVATGTLQSRYAPARHWGVDPERRTLRWVQVRNDGDYLYASGDSGYAEPFDTGTLRDCIDGLIADDLAAVRERRGLT